MNDVPGYCDVCGKEIVLQYCCTAFDCGCMGKPIDPPVCSNECYDKYMETPEDREGIDFEGVI